MNNFEHEQAWAELAKATKTDPIASEALDRLADGFNRDVREAIAKARVAVR